MSKVFRSILFIIFFCQATGRIALAVETASSGIITRPVIEYKSSSLRDPFSTYFTKEEPKAATQVSNNSMKPALDITKLRVQGIIWGVKNPQAIINDQVLSIGNTIEGAEILSIEKKGITLSSNGVVFDLVAPGQSAVLDK
jgi:hypothetical protein